MKTRHIIGVAILCVLLVCTISACIVVLLPKMSQKPSLTVHGMSSHMNFALDHLPKLPNAYVVDDSVVFPVALFNGSLPLLMIHVGESNTMAAAIIDTGSEMLLLGDTERCKTCSTNLFGGAKGSDSNDTRTYGKGVIEFGSQKDHVEFRREDIFIDGFAIPNIKFGLVTHRQSLTSDSNITYNIMGIGGAQSLEHALLNQMHRNLMPKKVKRFGFMLGHTGNDYLDDEGVFVLGKIPKSLLDEPPSTIIPLHTKPLSSFYYTTHVKEIHGVLRNGQTFKYKLTNCPIMFDTGSNYSDFPKVLNHQFNQLDRIVLVFDSHTKLVLPNNGLMWNRRPSSPLVTFTNTDIITIGTVLLSKFKAIEFVLDKKPHMNVYSR